MTWSNLAEDIGEEFARLEGCSYLPRGFSHYVPVSESRFLDPAARLERRLTALTRTRERMRVEPTRRPLRGNGRGGWCASWSAAPVREVLTRMTPLEARVRTANMLRGAK